jgi:hypothetical protein
MRDSNLFSSVDNFYAFTLYWTRESCTKSQLMLVELKPTGPVGVFNTARR